jgi:transposase
MGATLRIERMDYTRAELHLAISKIVRWRCADRQAGVTRRWSVSVYVSTIGRWLGELGLPLLQPRPAHPMKEAEAEATFKKTFTAW